MTDFPWLTTLVAVPAAGSLVVALLPRGRELLAKRLALAFALAALAWSFGVVSQFDTGSSVQFQLAETYSWIPALGVSFALGVDGIALVLIVLTALLTPLVLLGSWHDAAGGRYSVKTFFSLMLALEALTLGVFLATDVFLFYLLFESMLIPMYFLIGGFGGAQRSYAAVKFLLYSLFGGLLMLAAVIVLYIESPGGDEAFLLQNLIGLDLDETTARWLFLGFFIAFAIKAPLWPFHTWLPDATAQATPGSSVMLVGVLDKVGTFGMIRLLLPLFPEASDYFTPLVIALSVVGILYGALLAIGQTDMMRLIAYTSVSHFGFIVLGIFAMTSQGQTGSTLYMVNHGLATGALFLIAGFLISRRGSRLIDDYGGVQRVAPVLAGTFLMAGLASLALPGLAPFVSEFLVLVGTYTRYEAVAVVATFGIILAAVYILVLYKRTMTGQPTPETKGMTDLVPREVWAVAPLIALILAVGVYPKPALDVITPAVDRTLDSVQQTDPAPTEVAEGTSGGTNQ